MRLFDIYIDLLHEEKSNIMTAQEIADYIYDITPNKSDVPEYFINQVIKSNKTFKYKMVSIKDLLMSDPSLEEYVESNEERYGDDSENEYEPTYSELLQPIVVFNGEVIDGYSRVASHYHSREDLIYAYISQ